MQNVSSWIKAVVFDMGGVLLRTIYPESRIELAKQVGLDRERLEDLFFHSSTALLAEMDRASESQHWEWLFSELKLKDFSVSEFRERFFSGDRVNEELLEYINELRTNYQTGLLSNAWQSTREFVSSHYRFLDYFDESIFSAEVGTRKPGADIYHIMLQRLQVEAKEVVFVDDMLANVEGARAVGMKAILFEDSQQVILEINSLL